MIRIIAVVDQKLGLAKNGDQFIRLPDDQTYFKKQTKLYGGNILRGRKEYEVAENPLDERHCFVATRQPLTDPGITVVPDVQAFLSTFQDDLWVIGGASIYAQTIDQADELYLTHVEADFDCDQFFPAYPDFEQVSRSDMHHQQGYDFYYAVYTRRAL